ncbi:hypothetical protein Taro_038823, partial [Colocasia esculenta]|nr:hypothetical protein [Colocasia esculenta]
MPTAVAASIFKVPDEGADYHEFEFDLHEAYSILTGLPADESNPKQTYVTMFNANTFPPVLRVIHHILTTIITPQGGGRDRLTDIQRFILYCMVKDIKINLHVILYQIIAETTRTDLKRSLPYGAHLTSVFKHFGVPLENEKSQSIPKSNIYTFKNIQKFMGFRLEGNQIRRGPIVVEAPQAQEDQPQVQGDQPQAQEDQPPAQGDQNQADQPPPHEGQPQVQEEQVHLPEDQPLMDEDQPYIPPEGGIQLETPIPPQDDPSSSLPHPFEPPHFPSTFQSSTSSGGSSIPPELFSFLNAKFDTLNSTIQTILIGTLGDSYIELKEHLDKLEKVLQGILANSQADVFNTKQTLHEISSTRLSFAHFVDDLESMRNFNEHIDRKLTDLTKEFKIIQRP